MTTITYWLACHAKTATVCILSHFYFHIHFSVKYSPGIYSWMPALQCVCLHCPTLLPGAHSSLGTRLCIARSALLRSGHTGFLSHQSPLRWRLAQRSARDSSIAAVPVQGALHHMTSFLLFRVLFTLSNCTVVYIVSFHGPSLKNVFLTRALTVAHGSLSWAWDCVRQMTIDQFSSVQSLSRVRLFATPWIAVRQASLSITNSRSSLKLMSIKSVMPSSHLILCRPLLLLSPIPPSIRVSSNESTLHMRWPKYWSFSLSISPSNEHPGLVSFRMDWLDLLAGTLKSSPTPQFKSINSSALSFLYSPTLTSIHDSWKNHSFH